MKLAVIVSDAVGCVHVGLDVERTVRTFDMPEEIRRYVEAKKAPYVSVTFALVEPDTAHVEGDKQGGGNAAQ